MTSETLPGLLSDRAILREMSSGTIVIEPFVRENLSTSSYDVTLGRYFYREQRLPSGSPGIYNPYSEAMTNRIWGEPQHAELASAWSARTGIALENIFGDDELIWIAPGETVLAHTQEFIGGRHSVTTMMKARSSLGRSFIEICKCAGLGDVGYINRWTMEITNNSVHHAIPLVVGRRIAQIVFFKCEPILDEPYEKLGKYQSASSLDELRRCWAPSMMLPRLFKDREVVRRLKQRQQQQQPTQT